MVATDSEETLLLRRGRIPKMRQELHTATAQVFKYFEEICAIPHGSGHMDAICAYCMRFAESNGLKALRDEAQNVVMYKPGTKGYENAAPVILQGHIDMVCQKTEESPIDFAKDGLETFTDGDFIQAKGTTLGADNGIAVAMMMAILASRDLPHPPREAVFTTDEEIGMIGAQKLDTTVLKGRKMINLDAEEAASLTVSCAGGSDVKIFLPMGKKIVHGTKVVLEIKGLQGGHSGVEIDKGRVNANILAGRILNAAKKAAAFDLIQIHGGTKGNAIPFCCRVELVAKDAETFMRSTEAYFAVVKKEIRQREEQCSLCLTPAGEGDFEVWDSVTRDKLMYMLLTTPNGVVDMSAEIEGLVETSLNLGILTTEPDGIAMQYALRSNKKSALAFLEDKLTAFAAHHDCRTEVSGRYRPWEFREDSLLQKIYREAFCEKFGHLPQVAAIHAGLECAVFAAKIQDLDCIAIGPDMFGVHTVNERLSISSTREIFEVLCETLKRCT